MSAEIFPHLLPMVIVAIGALLVLALEPLFSIQRKHIVLPIVSVAFLLLGAFTLPLLIDHQIGDLLLMDSARRVLLGALLLATAVSIGALSSQLKRDAFPGGEAYGLLMLSSLGAMLMLQSTSTLALFLGMELSAIPIYALVGMRRKSTAANESLLKYFIFGAVFSAIFLYGAALWYGATGSLSFSAESIPGYESLQTIALGLIVASMLFKTGAFPFHSWVADAYSGAALPITTFMATSVKIASVSALSWIWMENQNDLIMSLLASAGILSIALGSITGLAQNSVRRIMAFSGISNAGFLVFALLLPNSETLTYYLLVYVLGTLLVLGGFTALLSTSENADESTQLRGIARRNPLIGAITTLGLVSLSGMPPVAGFLAKFSVLASLYAEQRIWLSGIALGLTVMAIGYYYRLARLLWEPSDAETTTRTEWLLPSLLILTAGILFALSLWPQLYRL